MINNQAKDVYFQKTTRKIGPFNYVFSLVDKSTLCEDVGTEGRKA